MSSSSSSSPSLAPIALISGSGAGLAVDLLFFPIDTIKTRLQAQQGFWNAGGFSRIYSGIASVAVGSGPGAAAFFLTYEYLNAALAPLSTSPLSSPAPWIHMLSASGGEIAACLIRVPTDVVKQNSQASLSSYSSLHVAKNLITTQGWSRLYSGFATTIAREIPFTAIQFPLYERLKHLSFQYLYSSKPSHQRPPHLPNSCSALCGCIAGGIAAAVTTPLDVAKTRIMLGQSSSSSFPLVLAEIYSSSGTKALFNGIIPRTIWISLGGAVFLGAYESIKNSLLLSSIF